MHFLPYSWQSFISKWQQKIYLKLKIRLPNFKKKFTKFTKSPDSLLGSNRVAKNVEGCLNSLFLIFCSQPELAKHL
jgi:hypothetical protein